jgi:sec-independent protein translocase protein TatA
VSLSFLQVVIIILAIVLLFGRHRISDMMKDIAKGMKAFKAELEPDHPERHTGPESKTPSLKKPAQPITAAPQATPLSPPVKTAAKPAVKKASAAKKPVANKALAKKSTSPKASGATKPAAPKKTATAKKPPTAKTGVKK